MCYTSIFFFSPYYPNTKVLEIFSSYMFTSMKTQLLQVFFGFQKSVTQMMKMCPHHLNLKPTHFDLHLALSNIVKLIVTMLLSKEKKYYSIRNEQAIMTFHKKYKTVI